MKVKGLAVLTVILFLLSACSRSFEPSSASEPTMPRQYTPQIDFDFLSDRLHRITENLQTTTFTFANESESAIEGPQQISDEISLIITNPSQAALSEYDCIYREPQWTTEELQAMALTLAGECYDDKEMDKRRVCEVILNRVSSDQFDDSIIEVLTAKNQFLGYWIQSRPVTENDLAIAKQALKDWYDNGCKPLSEYLFFHAGENRENNFW